MIATYRDWLAVSGDLAAAQELGQDDPAFPAEASEPGSAGTGSPTGCTPC